MKYIYKEKEYDVEIIKKNNKNTYMRVRDDKIYITTNNLVSDKRIELLLEENRKEINKLIDRENKIAKKRELFLLFGEYYDIIYGDFERKVTVEDGKIFVVSEEELKIWLNNYIHSTFYRNLMYWQRQFEEEIPIPELKIKQMKTRWGVCNNKTNIITLNLELFRYPIECLEYVIVHELAHFLEHNHSQKFWDIVEKYYPNYKEAKKKLKY